MADFNYDELEELQLELESEDGEKLLCDLLCIFEYNKKDYEYYLKDFEEADNDDEEQNVFFFSVQNEAGKNDDEVELGFEMIDDEDLLEELLAILQEITDEDDDSVISLPEEDLDDDDDEDDSKWDEFIKKKL